MTQPGGSKSATAGRAAPAPLRVEWRDGVCMLTLARPEKMNALSAELVEALIAAVDEAAARGVRLIALRGEGRNFSAGFDFGGWETQSEGDLLLRFVRIETLLQRLASSPCLTLALAHGRNFGAGVDLAGACKWRVGEAGATFRMPGLKFGLVLGTRRYAALVGAERARAVLEQAATFDAETALRDGFLTRLAAQAAWDGIVDEAARVAGGLAVTARAQLYAALDAEDPDGDLARLVRSAAEPGLKQRIARYLEAR
ncbi:enoyl-CoA hydratase/isomerase family protein [Achromobacter sp. Marseille-Q4962]|uniref:enoyl-CoA hydratase/isomerase family protein n=1 Tax=Achromobacter sp. Marseille-Q4962 TaxID=2942202 RepID=UPI00255D099F|nr:enoyl-CoA hydratase/isomerase family protein [Achromobacter sp. Marseille-Q4962]